MELALGGFNPVTILAALNVGRKINDQRTL